MAKREISKLLIANTQSGDYHIPVMLTEVLDGLHVNPEGIYVDCTFGGGGHSSGILQRLNRKGRLIAFDQDSQAKRNLPDDNRVIFVPQNFRHMQRFLRLHSVTAVDGILADLGVSSNQFDEAKRGFSIRFDGPLDMRMNAEQSINAADIVNNYGEEQLHKLLEQYGEVTNAKTLARKIVEERKKKYLSTIRSFKNAVGSVVKGNPNKYFAQVFQSLRIEVNDELGALKEMLQQTPSLLRTGGRIVIISFHSLEDRIVKNFFKRGSIEETDQSNPFGQSIIPQLQVITKKPIVPTDVEIKQNPRSRSAKLRIAERI
jgi:16S rRNA (cytosine1402-N4)-methyltransferase